MRNLLGVRQQVQAVMGLDEQPVHPPQRHQHTEDRDPPRRPPHLAPRVFLRDQHRVGQPQGRRDDDIERCAGVGAADGHPHEGEQRGVAPTPRAHRPDDDGQQPTQSRPRQEQDRDAPDVFEEVGREHEGEGGHKAPRTLEPHGPAQVEHSGAGPEEQDADPQPLGSPHRDVQALGGPEEGAHGPQKADPLMGDRAQPVVGVPHRYRLTQESTDVDVEVGLGVRGHDPGLRPQLGHEGNHGEDQVLEPCRPLLNRRDRSPCARCRQAHRVPPLRRGPSMADRVMETGASRRRPCGIDVGPGRAFLGRRRPRPAVLTARATSSWGAVPADATGRPRKVRCRATAPGSLLKQRCDRHRTLVWTPDRRGRRWRRPRCRSAVRSRPWARR